MSKTVLPLRIFFPLKIKVFLRGLLKGLKVILIEKCVNEDIHKSKEEGRCNRLKKNQIEVRRIKGRNKE